MFDIFTTSCSISLGKYSDKIKNTLWYKKINLYLVFHEMLKDNISSVFRYSQCPLQFPLQNIPTKNIFEKFFFKIKKYSLV